MSYASRHALENRTDRDILSGRAECFHPFSCFLSKLPLKMSLSVLATTPVMFRIPPTASSPFLAAPSAPCTSARESVVLQQLHTPVTCRTHCLILAGVFLCPMPSETSLPLRLLLSSADVVLPPSHSISLHDIHVKRSIALKLLVAVRLAPVAGDAVALLCV
eukprot:765606-Hanusia_phi.AAC.3